MWIFSETGFVSAVLDRKDDSRFVVRGRDSESLMPLADYAVTDVVSGGGTDYPFRVFVDRIVFLGWLSGQVGAIDYTNYKSRMYETRGEQFVEALHDVWEDMQAISPMVDAGRMFRQHLDLGEL